MNNRRLLIAAVFNFMHPVEKDSKKHHMLAKNFVSFSCQSKQVSRCCINFLSELTCQILTNQSIKIGRRAWSTRDYGKKSEKPVFPACIFKWQAEFSRPRSVRLRAVSLFFCSPSSKTRDTQMATRVTDGASPRACISVTKSEEKERLLAVKRSVWNQNVNSAGP